MKEIPAIVWNCHILFVSLQRFRRNCGVMKNPFDKILNWYFTKNSLPYWCIFLIDCAIVMFSCALVYWIFNNFAALVDNALPVLLTSSVFTLVSIVGFRIFHTYSGFMRYASFVDLMRVTYGNLINLGLALVADLLLQSHEPVESSLFHFFRHIVFIVHAAIGIFLLRIGKGSHALEVV